MSRWLVRGGAVAGAWAIVVVPMILVGMGPRPVLLALVAAAVATTLWCVIDIAPSAEPIRWLRPRQSPPRPLEDPRANQLVRLVEAAPDDPNRAAALRRLLADLGGPDAEHAAAAGADERPLRLIDIDRLVRSIETP